MDALVEKKVQKKASKKDVNGDGMLGGKGKAGRVPPHSLESEQALIACCVFDGGQDSMTACIEAKVGAESFFKPAHQIIFQSLVELYDKGVPIDEIILGDKLKSKGEFENVGGYGYINAITNRIDTAAHMPHYLKKVRDLYLLRRLISTSIRTIERAYTEQEDLEYFLEEVEQEVFKISEDRVTDSAKPIKESMDAVVNLVSQMLQRKGSLTGVTSGLRDLDKMTFGFHAQEMIVIAARPSMGKTSLALNIAEAVVMHKDSSRALPTLMFSLEMGSEQLAMRLLCSWTKTDMQKLKDGFLDEGAHASLARGAKELKEAPLWIDDSGYLTILEMRAKARRLHSQKGLGLVIIDYLQLISGSDGRVPREQQIADISRGVKAMAKELNVPVVVLSQLNRESEKEKRQPRISDLRESGSIEQDADLVLLLAKKRDSNEEQGAEGEVVLRDLIIAKQRNGPIGLIPLVFNKRYTRFENYTGQGE